MGIIKSQGIKQSLVVYTGAVVGALSWILIYPNLETEELGLIKFIQETGLLVVPFLYLGANALSVRFFPVFKDEKNGHNGFLLFLLSLLSVGCVLFLMLYAIFRDNILDYYANLSEEYVAYLDYLPYIIPVTLLLAFSGLLTQYTMNFKRIAIPAIFNDLFVKVGIISFVLLYLSQIVDWSMVINGIVIVYAIVLLCMVGYLIHLRQLHLIPNRTKLKKPLLKEMGVYAGYGIFGNLGSQLATRIDTFMVASLIDLTSTGIFAFSAYIGNVIEIPRRAISKISTPILVESLQNGDQENVAKLYRKSALVQLIVGAFILGGIWLCVDDLFLLMKNGSEYARGKYIILVLGIAIVIDMLTGVNDEIISYSKYFRYRFYFILCLAIFNVIANFLFIVGFELGILGAALATLFSKSLYNLIKFVLLKVKMNIQPFSVNMLWVVGIVISCYFIVTLLPLTEMVFVNILIKSIVFTLLYGGLIYGFQISLDINELVDSAWQKAISFIKK